MKPPNRKNSIPPILLLTIGTIAGCGGTDTDLPGRAGSDAPELAWSIADDPLLRIGGDEGVVDLHRVSSAIRLDDGGIVIADANSPAPRTIVDDHRQVIGTVAVPPSFRGLEGR